MNRRIFLLTAALVTFSGLAGCQSDKGKKYLGTWKRTNVRSNQIITIERNGDSFVLIRENKRFPASLTDTGMLELSGGFGMMTGSIDEKTGHFLIAGEEYARHTP